MRNFIALSLLVLSCGAATSAARADVIITGDDTVIIDGKRFSDRDKGRRNRDTYRDNGVNIGRGLSGRDSNILIYNGNSSRDGGDLYVIKNGKFTRSTDGIYDLGDGDFIDPDSNYNGKVGGVEIRN